MNMAQKNAVSPIATKQLKLEHGPQSGGALPFDSALDAGDVNLDIKEPKGKKERVPRRVLHFSDGTLEEYSTDEEEEDKKKEQPKVDPKLLTWLPWFWYYIVAFSYGMLHAADTCGEKIAWWLGITSPKYQYILDEYHRIRAEEMREKMEEEMLMKSIKENKEPEVVVHGTEANSDNITENKFDQKNGNL